MLVSDFDYDLPSERIAQKPLEMLIGALPPWTSGLSVPRPDGTSQMPKIEAGPITSVDDVVADNLSFGFNDSINCIMPLISNNFLFAISASPTKFVFPRFFIDDYNFWMGHKKAIDDYFSDLGETLLMCRIDSSAAMAVVSETVVAKAQRKAESYGSVVVAAPTESPSTWFRVD